VTSIFVLEIPTGHPVVHCAAPILPIVCLNHRSCTFSASPLQIVLPFQPDHSAAGTSDLRSHFQSSTPEQISCGLGLGKIPQGILQNQSIRGFFGFESTFQNCFWNVFSTSGLSQICKIRNAWKLPVPFQGLL
jgi:hypothetical protein